MRKSELLLHAMSQTRTDFSGKRGPVHTPATHSQGARSSIFCELVPVLQRGLGSRKRWSQKQKPLHGCDVWDGGRFYFPYAITCCNKVQNGLEVQREGRSVAVQEPGKS